MVKARRVLAEMIPSQDVIVEVLDARMPAASENPLLAQLRGGKPCLKVLSKADLADPAVTRAWLARYETGPRSGRGAVAAIATSTTRLGEAKGRILELCKRLAGNPTGPGRVVRAAVAGVPNVGKSTLINALAGRRVAAVGDTPGVTKASQQVVLNSGVALHDHPGLLWPRVDDETQALRLALGGALPGTTFDYENVALFGAKLFLERYPKLLLERFKLKALPPSADALLDEIGRRRGAIRAGGVIDRHKAAEVLLRDFRSGALGRISLETPDDALASSRANLGAAGDAFMNDPLSVAPAGDAFTNDPVSVAPAGEVPSGAHEESELPEDA
jgi:ribosome biogenesis GTPase A